MRGLIPLVSSSLSLMSALTGSPQCLCPALSTEVNLRTIWRRQLLLITTPCRQPDLVSSSTVINRLSFGGSSLTLFKGVSPRMRVARELLRGLGDTGSSLPSCPSLSLDNHLYREDFPWSTQGRRDLSSFGVNRPKSWRLEGVRIWKLSRTYPGEKPPSLFVLTHRCSLVTRKPTWHLLTMPYILVRIGAPYEGWWPAPFHLPRNYGTVFKPMNIKI